MPDARTNLSDLPDCATVYVPGYGETTLGELRASTSDPWADTVSMWGWIVTHPYEVPKPWRGLKRTRRGVRR